MVDPPFNEAESSFLRDFANSRRMSRTVGPYFVKGDGFKGQDTDNTVIDSNGTGCVDTEWVANPDHDPTKRYGDDGYAPPRIRVPLATPICPPEYDTPAHQPGLWCQWIPGGDLYIPEGHPIPDEAFAGLGWDGGEKFYDSPEWMRYIIDNFLRPGAFASTPQGQQLVELAGETERFSKFTYGHTCNGVIYAEGEESNDRWRLVVHNNEVTVQDAAVVWPNLPEGMDG